MAKTKLKGAAPGKNMKKKRKVIQRKTYEGVVCGINLIALSGFYYHFSATKAVYFNNII